MGLLGFDQTSLIRVVGYCLAATGANRVNRRVFPSSSSKGDVAGHLPLRNCLVTSWDARACFPSCLCARWRRLLRLQASRRRRYDDAALNNGGIVAKTQSPPGMALADLGGPFSSATSLLPVNTPAISFTRGPQWGASSRHPCGTKTP